MLIPCMARSVSSQASDKPGQSANKVFYYCFPFLFKYLLNLKDVVVGPDSYCDDGKEVVSL